MHNRNIKSIIFLIGFLLLFFHFSSNLYSQESKIRIIEPDAVVRLKPNQESIVIIKAPLGSVLTVVEIRDEWFKVKLLPDKDGIVVFGYIHKSYIETAIDESDSAQIPEQKKEIIAKPKKITAKMPITEDKLEFPGDFEINKYNKVELKLTLGMGMPKFSGYSNHSDTGSIFRISNFHERSNLNASSSNELSYEGALSFSPIRNFGFQVSIGYFKPEIKTDVSFDFDWRWNDGRSYSEQENWEGNGELSVTAINLDCVVRFGDKGIAGYISGGYSIFNNKFNSNAYMGTVVSDIDSYYYYGHIYYTQYVDALKIPVEINESWVGKGMNIGGGIDFIFAKNVALTLGARYYYCPSIELKWKYSTGNYDGLYGSYRWTINKDYTNAYEIATSVLTVDPSFTMLSCGLKFMF